ncbi:MAG: hypothetical protein KatS3mg077_2236 [Candidatus Binatia bacterium]|nr:MAG: hypothetical protein KatS3mg077_2236 [Candidatus Binatia bacterium]
MAVTVKQITLWRKEAQNAPGVLAEVLEPLAASGANLRLVMGYALGDTGRAAVEVFPVSGKKSTAAATQVGLHTAQVSALLVEGDDRPGLGAAMARGVANAGVNIEFVVAQTVGRKFSAVFGFRTPEDARAAAKAIKAAAKPARPARSSKKR